MMKYKLITYVFAALTYTTGAYAETVTYNGFDYNGYGAGELGLITTTGMIEAFCLGPPTPVLWSGTSNEEMLTPGFSYPELPGPLSNAQVGEIGALVLDGEQWIATQASPAEAAAAIAIAIWRVEGYGFPYSVSSFGTASSAWINTESDWYYNAATSGALNPYYNVGILYDDGNQPLVTLIPETSTWLMMLTGFSLLGWARFFPPRKALHSVRAGLS